ncbi:MAG: hypothetical protein AAFR90_14820 [Pseudomonadota bacterium]
MTTPPQNFDPARYLHHFDNCTISRDEKIELIEALWLVAQSFADEAFGMTPKLPIRQKQMQKTGKTDKAGDIVNADMSAPDCAANDNAPIQQTMKGQARA